MTPFLVGRKQDTCGTGNQKLDKGYLLDTISGKLKIHFDLSFKMLVDVIESCPDNLWIIHEENKSLWKRILHVLEGIDFWISDFSDYAFTSLFDGFTAEMDLTNNAVIEKNDMLTYKILIEDNLKTFFKNIDDISLLRISSRYPGVSFLDIILSQIRHIQINLGYCNAAFNMVGIKGVKWLGYNEECQEITEERE